MRAGRELVIRRPPQGQLLPKAHDMWREYRIIDGLWPTAVPVAEPIAYCDDRAVAETHFYVMGKVEGEALYTAAAVTAWLDEPARRRAGESFVDVLAALHALDPADVGLAELGRHDGYIARQLRTWYGSWTASIDAAGLDDPRVHELHELLSARIPEQGPARVVHGDYGPHNCLFGRDGAVDRGARLGDRDARRPARRLRLLDQRVGRAGRRWRLRRRPADRAARASPAGPS